MSSLPTNPTRRRPAMVRYGMGLLALAGISTVGVSLTTAADNTSSTSCTTATYSWSGFSKLHTTNTTFDTGVVIPTPAAGTTMTVQELRYSSYDGYSPDGGISRTVQNQGFEGFGVRIGSVDVDDVTPDLPDSADEGAPYFYYSGVVSGRLPKWAGVVIQGGMIQARHSSLYGLNDGTPSSMTPAEVTVVVRSCPLSTVNGTGDSTTTTAPRPVVTPNVATVRDVMVSSAEPPLPAKRVPPTMP